MRYAHWSLFLAWTLTLTACAGNVETKEEAQTNPPAAVEAADTMNLAEPINAFTFDLFRVVREAGSGGNTIVSPYSVATALAMVYAGSEGETAAQMAKVLHFPANSPAFHKAIGGIGQSMRSTNEYQLLVANALWPNKEFVVQESYLALMKDAYATDVTTLDYIGATEASRKTINTWVEDKTNDRIQDLIPSGMLDPATRMVLTNAIYFKGLWLTQFKKENTSDMPFHLADGSEKQTPMMRQHGDFRYTDNEWMQAIDLPYEGEKVAMTILLPREGSDVARVIEALSPEFMASTLGNMGKRSLDLVLPKFTMTETTFMTDLLVSMGMGLAFSGDADFSGISGKPDLYISDVVHKAFIEVNEEGTEAAAATGIIMKTTAAMIPLTFQADRPFVFLIRNTDNNCILFTGVVANPEPGDA